MGGGARAAGGQAGAAAGATVAPAGAPAAVRASQAIVAELTLASLDPAAGRLGFAPSCNLALAREALERLPFDESFPAAAGEDRDWSARAGGAGLGPVYVPRGGGRAPPGARRRPRSRASSTGYGRGAARYRGGGAGRGLARPGFYAGLVRRGFARGCGSRGAGRGRPGGHRGGSGRREVGGAGWGARALSHGAGRPTRRSRARRR